MVLQRYLDEKSGQKANQGESSSLESMVANPKPESSNLATKETNGLDQCPDCGGSLKYESGCEQCIDCGFSRCG